MPDVTKVKMKENLPCISIVIPVYNEEAILDRCLASVEKLDYPPERLERIMVDAYSTDKSIEIAKRYGFKVLFNKSRYHPAGCNLGISAAQGEFVYFTDADCVLEPVVFKELIKYLSEDRVASVGGPNITPSDDTNFGKAVGEVLVFLSSVGVRYGFRGKEVAEVYHNPSCNSIYRKAVLEQLGGFNENLEVCGDEEIDHRIRKEGYKILYCPQAVVYHYRRKNYYRFFEQAFTYAKNRGWFIKIHPDITKWFHFTPTAIFILFICLFILSVFHPVFFLWPFLSLTGLFFLLLLVPSFCLWCKHRTQNLVIYFLLIVTWLIGWSGGFLTGLCLPLRNKERVCKQPDDIA